MTETKTESYLDKFGVGTSTPWQEGKAPIVRFVTDDDKVVGMMFGHIQRTYEDRVINVLVVSGPAGVVVIRGPDVPVYHDKLAQGIADIVKPNGKGITSILYYPPASGEEEEEAAEELERYA
jgi:hypothetical protein